MKHFMFAFILLMTGLSTSNATAFNGSRFLKISATEQAAVVKKADGELQLLKAGDKIDDETRIVAFEDNHVVLEGPGEWGPVKYIVEVTQGEMKVIQLARRPLEKTVMREGR